MFCFSVRIIILMVKFMESRLDITFGSNCTLYHQVNVILLSLPLYTQTHCFPHHFFHRTRQHACSWLLIWRVCFAYFQPWHVTKMTTLTYLFIGVVRTKEKHPWWTNDTLIAWYILGFRGKILFLLEPQLSYCHKGIFLFTNFWFINLNF